MKKHINLLTVIMVAVVVASMFAKAKGINVPNFMYLGFSSGG
jgi:hypothetical protein